MVIITLLKSVKAIIGELEIAAKAMLLRPAPEGPINDSYVEDIWPTDIALPELSSSIRMTFVVMVVSAIKRFSPAASLAIPFGVPQAKSPVSNSVIVDEVVIFFIF